MDFPKSKSKKIHHKIQTTLPYFSIVAVGNFSSVLRLIDIGFMFIRITANFQIWQLKDVNTGSDANHR